jgi:hydantoinase/carbamoylase family amidase
MLQRLDMLAQIGASEAGGITRLAFTPEDSHARALVVGWMREAGLDVRISPIGNIVGRLDGTESDAPAVMTGSHVDTVISAGKFDGTLGVISSLEAVQAITAAGIRPRHPLEVVCFVMEESARFSVGYAFGSKVMVGKHISDEMLLAEDLQGKRLAEEIYANRAPELGHGRKPRSTQSLIETVRGWIAASRAPMERVKAFLELHIEQGPILESLGLPIGIVSAIAAPTRARVIFHGEQNHSGTTPMTHRRDALTAAAEVILAVERICSQAQNVVGTVGVIEAKPNIMTAIPGEVQIALDIRSTSASDKAQVVDTIREEIAHITGQRDIAFEFTLLADEIPQPLSERIAGVIAQSCQALGIKPHNMVSGAGHDAAQIATAVADTGMIFVPSRHGISHDPREWTAEEHIQQGAQVLALSLLNLAS